MRATTYGCEMVWPGADRERVVLVGGGQIGRRDEAVAGHGREGVQHAGVGDATCLELLAHHGVAPLVPAGHGTVLAARGWPAVWQSARMPDDTVLDGLDPYDLMDAEAARIDRYVAALGPTELEAPSACAGWSVQDVVAHLAAGEEYNHACLDDGIGALFERLGAVGVSDMDSFNEYGVRQWAGRPIDEVLGEWRRRLRAHTHRAAPPGRQGDPDRHRAVPGALAGVPPDVGAGDARRRHRRAGERACPTTGGPASPPSPCRRSTLRSPSSCIPAPPASSCDDRDVTLTTEDLVAATNGRLSAEHPLDPALRAALNVVGS